MHKFRNIGFTLTVASVCSISVCWASVSATADPSKKITTSPPVKDSVSAPVFTGTELDLLQSGEILIRVSKSTLDGEKAAYIQSGVLIDASAQEIWPVFTDCARAPTFVKGLVSCEILKQAKDKSWDVRRHVNKPARLLPKMKSEFKADYTYPNKVAFHNVGGDFTGNVGRWDLIAWPRSTEKSAPRTIVTYNAKIASKTVVPDKMIRKILKKNITDVLRSLRQEVMSDKAKKVAKPAAQ